jgi:hypothetical protein
MTSGSKGFQGSDLVESAMQVDYPAAHSMDTEWYAVDQQGQVAVFISGENGHVPDVASDESFLEALWRFQRPGAGEVDELWERDPEEVFAELGLFYYDYGPYFDPVGPYERLAQPVQPLHVDQLPPEMRTTCKRIRFARINFADSELVQPLEEFDCNFWYERVAYLAADGQTVRPIPGEEAQFAEFVSRFERENPRQAKQFHFEFPDEPS